CDTTPKRSALAARCSSTRRSQPALGAHEPADAVANPAARQPAVKSARPRTSCMARGLDDALAADGPAIAVQERDPYGREARTLSLDDALGEGERGAGAHEGHVHADDAMPFPARGRGANADARGRACQENQLAVQAEASLRTLGLATGGQPRHQVDAGHEREIHVANTIHACTDSTLLTQGRLLVIEQLDA